MEDSISRHLFLLRNAREQQQSAEHDESDYHPSYDGHVCRRVSLGAFQQIEPYRSRQVELRLVIAREQADDGEYALDYECHHVDERHRDVERHGAQSLEEP